MVNPTTFKKEEIPPHVQAWREEIYQIGQGPHYTGEVPMHVDYCVFHEGIHYAGELCPHGTEEYPNNWTAQNK